MNVLSIDAWSTEDNEWNWNRWYTVGTLTIQEFELIEREEGYIQWFINNSYIPPLRDGFFIDDDGYNIIICDMKTNEPIYAIEYGCEY